MRGINRVYWSIAVHHAAPVARAAPSSRAPVSAPIRRAVARMSSPCSLVHEISDASSRFLRTLAVARTTSASSRSNVSDAAVQALSLKLEELNVDVEGLKKERDFYFAKVRPSPFICLLALYERCLLMACDSYEISRSSLPLV